MPSWEDSEEIKEAKEQWETALDHFKEHYAPLFASYQIDFSSAFMLFSMNRLCCLIDDILEKLDGEE